MISLTWSRAWWLAVGPRLDRRVSPQASPKDGWYSQPHRFVRLTGVVSLRLISRRRALACTSLNLFFPGIMAQTPSPRVGVFSLVGDSIELVVASAAKFQQESFKSLPAVDGELVGASLKAAERTIQQTLPGSEVRLYRSSTRISLDQQHAIAVAANQREVPEWISREIREDALNKLILITRHFGRAEMRTGTSSFIGVGTARGIGFYLDGSVRMHDEASGVYSNGVLAPYVQLRLQLLDAGTLEVLKTYDVNEGHALAAKEAKVANDPWNYIDAKTKSRWLQSLVDRGVSRGVQALLQP